LLDEPANLVNSTKLMVAAADYFHINFKLSGNYRGGGRRVWYTF